ncbi:hypothetical protein GCM10007276_34080 [Agaricicola taiwanensis]|uniref:Uncharacterized protein n=1 Tax=Agaricicola taiwanensis TaxID=591372 RepID=A0A8J2YMD4_9RHOB|nr:hypothetical protein [Agaricicola taiwanensis]GGE54183.1 hypothetical protein GCM10007276_34080 [Agaricicola taiwanensis]
MASDTKPHVTTEYPDAAAADAKPKGKAQDRPGFDLGGARDSDGPASGNIIPGGPESDPSVGDTRSREAGRLTRESDTRTPNDRR